MKHSIDINRVIDVFRSISKTEEIDERAAVFCHSAKETVEVPNLIGYNLSEVNNVAAAYGLNVSVKGASTTSDALSTQQSMPEGTKVSEGTVVTVTFAAQTGIAD